jgi:hypothetical protein
MKRIITTSVVDPSIQQPFTTKSLDFLQDNLALFADSIARALAPYEYDNGDPIALSGCEVTLGSPNTYFNGFVYWNNELFAFDGNTATITTTASFKIVVTNDATADPLTFTDGIARNVHNIRKLVAIDTSAGGGAFLYSDLKFVAKWKKTDYAGGVATATGETTLNTIAASQNGSNVVFRFNCYGQITGTGTSTFRFKKNGSTVTTVTITNTNANVDHSFTFLSTTVLASDTFTITQQGSTGSGTLECYLIAENG